MTVSRRTVIAGTALVSIAALCSDLVTPPALATSGGPRAVPEGIPVSENGWAIVESTGYGMAVWNSSVVGTVLSYDVRLGVVESVLTHLIQRYHYEVAPLHEGDLMGWKAPRSNVGAGPHSNLSSGTAVQIRPGHFPTGTGGGLFPAELASLRRILDELDGLVAWGGDEKEPDESLFWISANPSNGQLQNLESEIRSGFDKPGFGAGSRIALRWVVR
ncbi:hypothetical protein GCM10009751_19150 [Myceligenerans crystallogenes]|uniref:Uncharacterized protein n=1 Tax=Myceligenerans crystallogenes TaxID=316335 RepID=A0ABN2NBD2_9MICO